jgi:probable HAF family extracellular repeat protein
MTDLGTLGGDSSTSYGINSAGQIVGYADTVDDDTRDAVIWNPDGTRTDLRSLGGTTNYGYGINDAGQVTGYSRTTGDRDRHAAFWDSDGTITDLGTLRGTYSAGFGINGAGQVVGFSLITGDRDEHAVFWDADGTMTDLNTQIPPDSGWVLQEARGLNDDGLIIGFGTHNGQVHGFLLTPVGPSAPGQPRQSVGVLLATSAGNGVSVPTPPEAVTSPWLSVSSTNPIAAADFAITPIGRSTAERASDLLFAARAQKENDGLAWLGAMEMTVCETSR